MDSVDTPAGMPTGGLSPGERLVSWAGIIVLAILLALVFNAYLAPDMLINFANLVLCS